MFLKLEVTGRQINRARIYNNEGDYIRDAEMNDGFEALLNSVEIDMGAVMNMKYMAEKDKNFKRLVEAFDLKLLI